MDNDDTLGYLFDMTKQAVITTFTAVLDVVEDSFDCMTISTGKQMIRVCFATYAFIPLVFILQLLGKTTVVHIVDAAVASIVITFIWAINNFTDAQVKSSLTGMRNIVSKVDIGKVKGVVNKVKTGVNDHG